MFSVRIILQKRIFEKGIFRKEQKIMGNITRNDVWELAKSRSDELVQLVSDLIKIPSENPTGSQEEVVSFVEQYLEDAGISHERVFCNPEFPNVLAKMGSEDGFSVILNGHVDVVPAGDRSQWKWDPFGGEITDTKILGRGTSDMKAGVAGLLFAMKVLKDSQAELKGNIRLHIVSDEESGGQYGTSWLCEQGYADGGNAAIIAEPTSNWTIESGQKGLLHLIFKATGESAHGSLGNYKGDNAIFKLNKVLTHIDLLTRIEGHYPEDLLDALKTSQMVAEKELGVPGIGNVINHVSANVGLISGGTRPNMVPDYCEATIDCRLPYGVDHEEVEAAVKEMIAVSEVTGVSYELRWMSEANVTRDDSELVQAIKKNAEALWGFTVYPAWQWACSDAREYRYKGIPTIQYGPSNTEGIHAPNENVDIEDVVKIGQIYVLALCDMMGIE